jgi:hypothetical protein
LASFVEICGRPVECDPTAFVDQFLDTIILALRLEPGIMLSESHLLELELTYMTAYNGFQTTL